METATSLYFQLAGEELTLLKELLESERLRLMVEIRHTDHRAYRDTATGESSRKRWHGAVPARPLLNLARSPGCRHKAVRRHRNYLCRFTRFHQDLSGGFGIAA